MKSYDIMLETELYLKAKVAQEAVERAYEMAWATTYLSTDVQGLSHADTRRAASIKLMETQHKDLVDRLQEVRGDTRAHFMIREALIEIAKTKRSQL